MIDKTKKTMRQEMRERELKNSEEKRQEYEDNKKIQEKRAKFQLWWNKTCKARKDNYNKEHKGIVYTSRNRPNPEYYKEINSGEIMVETEGVMPISEQVRRFERAGVSLQESMGQLYDFGVVDDNNDGFRDGPVEQFSDKISGAVMLMEEHKKALQKVIKESKDVSTDKPTTEPEQKNTEKDKKTIPENNKNLEEKSEEKKTKIEN